MRDFWQNSGFHLLGRNDRGWLTVTPDFLRAYMFRPEIDIVPESCDAERAIHQALVDDPLAPIAEAALSAIEDPDARDNYRVFTRFRDHLLASQTIESAYLSLFRPDAPRVPALFLDQLTHVILRNVLDGCTDALRVRAAELLFRAQKVTITDGAIMVADEEIVEMRAARESEAGIVEFQHIGQLLTGSDPVRRSVDLDVLDERNANAYWARSNRFDTVLDISFTQPGLDGLCRVLESWTRHFLGVAITIYPVQAIRDERWVWHVGLDAEATGILNDLYNDVPLSEERNYRLLSLFRAEFGDAEIMAPQVRGRPVYLGMAMTESDELRIKPQNLLFNLPLAEAA